MSFEILTLVLFASFFILLATGLPIAWVLGGVGMLFTIIMSGSGSFVQAALCTWDTMMSFTLIAIPLFVLLGTVLQHSGLAEAIYHSMLLWAGRLPGGLAIGTVFICTLIAAMVGTIGAGIVVSSVMGMPEMRKRGYNDRMVIGAIMAGGTLGVLIPPSCGFLIYAAIVGLSVGKLFAAGLLPGLLLSALYMTYIGIRCAINPAMGPPLPPEERVGLVKKIASLKDSILAILLVVAVLGSIFGGVATPTEASAMGVFFALIIAAIYRSLNFKMLKGSIHDTLMVFTMFMFIYIGATIFSRFYMGTGVRLELEGIVAAWPVNPYVILVGMMAIIFVAGMVIFDIAIILVAAPIFTEIAVALGFDPLWFG
ncbi:MAG: TRAP transporter large permease subunit, partial [Dehalococcoidia bacterium]|nr:TRAP transporter large permease subunit [Dehalococcoidia bacterium]